MSFNQNESSMLDLVTEFVSGNITASIFEEKYLALWRNYRDSTVPKGADADMQHYFDYIFSAVDSYCSDPMLIDDDDLDDQGLFFEVLRLKKEWENHSRIV